MQLYSAAIRHGGELISCALICPAAGAWAYVERLDPPQVDGTGAGAGWFAQMRKVPGAAFVRGASSMTDAINGECQQLVSRVADGAARKVLLRLDRCDAGLASELGKDWAPVDQDAHALAAFRKLYSGRRKDVTPPNHSLLRALELAAVDPSPGCDVFFEEITRLELLLGTKNAQSMRAWFRRRAGPPAALRGQRGGRRQVPVSAATSAI